MNNVEKLEEMLRLAKLQSEGAVVEVEFFTHLNGKDWRPIGVSHSWTTGYNYRVKPEPLECWVVVDADGGGVDIVFFKGSAEILAGLELGRSIVRMVQAP